MFDSPLSASAYEILDVAPTIDDEGLRRAYRLQLRRTHPDAGGDAAVFILVQRAWELVGTPEGRAAYDRGHGFAEDAPWGGWHEPDAPADTRPRAKGYGTAGGWHRREYLARVAEWGGDPAPADPYDPAFVRTVPRELRRLLADALAEEDTARTVRDLGMGFTAWHDVDARSERDPSGKLDHVVLSPSGLYALSSEDFGGVVRLRGGEVIGPDAGDRAPVTAMLGRMRFVARTARVRFGGGVVVVPDDDLAQAAVPLGSLRGVPVVIVRRSALRTVLRSGVPGARVIGGNELFDIRSRLQQSVRFV